MNLLSCENTLPCFGAVLKELTHCRYMVSGIDTAMRLLPCYKNVIFSLLLWNSLRWLFTKSVITAAQNINCASTVLHWFYYFIIKIYFVFLFVVFDLYNFRFYLEYEAVKPAVVQDIDFLTIGNITIVAFFKYWTGKWYLPINFI